MNDDFLDVGFFRLAKNVSKHSTFKIKLGAVIVKKRPIAVGFNMDKTHPSKGGKIRHTWHAEEAAVRNAGRHDLEGATIYIYREKRKTAKSPITPALAKPCQMCEEILRDAGIKNVFYTTEEYPYYSEMVLE